MAIPTRDEALAAAMAPSKPYDARSMTRFKLRALPSGKVVKIIRRVTDDFEVALNDPERRFDFWHPGGEIKPSPSLGYTYGHHPAGWFYAGFKWEEDRPENVGLINLENRIDPEDDDIPVVEGV